jgi:hypothetical protein
MGINHDLALDYDNSQAFLYCLPTGMFFGYSLVTLVHLCCPANEFSAWYGYVTCEVQNGEQLLPGTVWFALCINNN